MTGKLHEFRALEVAQRALTLIEAHQAHCENKDAERQHDHAAVRAAVERIHRRIDSINAFMLVTAISFSAGALGIIGYLLANKNPWLN